MYVWLLLILFLLVVKLYMGDLSDKQKQKKYLLITGTAVALVMGLRYPDYKTVYDLKGYYNFYKNIHLVPWNYVFSVSRYEYGYVLLNKALSTIVPWPQFIFIAEGAFAVFCVSRFIYKNSNYPFYAMLFFVTLGTMTFMLTAFRQAFAIGLCLLSVEYIKKRKPVRFVLLIILATLFHRTAFIFGVGYFFIQNRTPTLKNSAISILFLSISLFFAKEITEFGNELIGSSFSGYVGNKLGGLVPILTYVFIISISYLYRKNLDQTIGLNMTVLGLAIYSMRYTTLALERISFYFTVGSIIALPTAILAEPNLKMKNFFKVLAIFLAISLFLYRLQSAEWAEYRFFWQ